ncbi:signal peptide peptidase SppA [Cyanobium sp. Morenito 9A2]|uniref:signal peptide peptidase SppA n=1 Tax=Cyanobium sp. Morenito 9A2 TaxID=2823718 RepID=UPI0020CC8021|nr:signal peptide peptidase SppA [Cyanobium sp. Morenito 9A2]MCP9848255.1 signal peptide peptidase SppA [Cyanobium sp. Morenito 9A2]
MPWPWRRKSRRKMARIAIEGPIAGATRERVLKALHQVEEREFPALLLRIDSPGGTVGDSQEIHAGLLRLRAKGCKVVASFGNISASGGVYVGVAAERIVANPGTITGSIGVILRGNNLSKLLERIGISFETVKSGLYKDILSPDRALSEGERELLQALIDSSYGQFVSAVAEGRGLSESVVRSFADGRVFSGAQAKELGLVDELGDEEDARRLAARLADLDEEKTRPVTFGRPRKGLGVLIPGRALWGELQTALSLELAWGGQPLWLYRP